MRGITTILVIILLESTTLLGYLPTVDATLASKWTRTPAEIGIIGESPPVSCDVNGDGYKEIFWAGKPYNNLTSSLAVVVCINGLTGQILWSKPYPHYWGVGNEMKHLPIMVYDFDKDGQYEVIAAGATICRNALTGDIEWQKTTNYFGWHNNGFIDYGTHVTLYTIGGGYLRRINASTGAIIGQQVYIGYTCWGGVSISDMNKDGQWDIAVGVQPSGYEVQLYNEDLSLKRWSKPICATSHCIKFYDIDSDGQEEIIVGSQAGSSSRIYKINYDGTYTTFGPFPGLDIHVATTVGDCDGDGHMEWISCDISHPIIVDLVTGQVEASILHTSFMHVSIADVLPYPGYEIIVPQGTPSAARIYRHTSQGYILVETIGTVVYFSVTGDIDNDGLNEILLAGGGMSVWETEVVTPIPEPITLIAFGGMKRLNNNVYYPLPGTNEPPSQFICNAHCPNTGVVEETIYFNGTAFGGTPPYSWLWDFGDGGTSSQQNPIHQYNTSGNYPIWLTVIDTDDSVANDSATLTISNVTLYVNISLAEQWNLISFPLNCTIPVQEIIVQVEGINYSWSNAVNSGFILNSMYSNSQNGSYILVNECEPGKGFWMYVYQDCILWVPNSNSNTLHYFITNISVGWNIRSIPYNAPIEKQNLSIFYDGVVYTWRNAIAYGLITNYLFQWNVLSQEYQLSEEIQPGKSYWMYAYNNCALYFVPG